MNKDVLSYLYHDLGKSDSEIAQFLNFDRTAVVHMRKRMGIPSRINTGRVGELATLRKLKEIFGEAAVVDMNEKDATSNFDILLFGDVRIEVKSACHRKKGDCFNFSFANPPKSRVKHSEDVWISSTGRTVKNLEKSCDFVVLVFIYDTHEEFMVIPSNYYLIKGKQTLRIRDGQQPMKYWNNFSILNAADNLKEG